MFTLLFFVFLLFIIKIQLFTDLGKALNKKQLKEVKGAWSYEPCGWGFAYTDLADRLLSQFIKQIKASKVAFIY
ncbi:hypothetical protein [uncultured Tenacibaculum sp.]|uniref:hypothetical protein n=1 Tax=uncultured Tenacibaculum sp. TaxID=174713 RepID=UPI00261428F3|nr:hypothetical protein [uncultured Tenacibaculum sp.]